MAQGVPDPAAVPAVQDQPGAPTQAAGQPSGLSYAVACYIFWGIMPVYFRLVERAGSVEIVAHRVIWSILLLLVIVAARRGLTEFVGLLRNPRAVGPMTVSALLIAVNWLVYIWAVANDHVVAGSLGYFLNPLVNVLLGWLVLKEKLRRAQWTAILLAASGVAIMAAAALDTLWISLMLAISFGLYGLVRKTAPVGPMQGLALETMILAPAALAYLGWEMARGQMAFGSDPHLTVLLILSGAVTSIPLLMFATAARRMAYSTLGVVQYIAPTIQFVIAVWVFKESLNTGQIASFALIWTGLAIFTLDALRNARRI